MAQRSLLDYGGQHGGWPSPEAIGLGPLPTPFSDFTANPEMGRTQARFDATARSAEDRANQLPKLRKVARL